MKPTKLTLKFFSLTPRVSKLALTCLVLFTALIYLHYCKQIKETRNLGSTLNFAFIIHETPRHWIDIIGYNINFLRLLFILYSICTTKSLSQIAKRKNKYTSTSTEYFWRKYEILAVGLTCNTQTLVQYYYFIAYLVYIHILCLARER